MEEIIIWALFLTHKCDYFGVYEKKGN